MSYELKQVPNEAQIRKYLRRILYGSHLFCPRCHARTIHRSEDRYRCRKCRKPFSLLSGTWLARMRLSLPTFWLVLWCWINNVPVLQTRKLCGLSEEAVRHWFHQFRVHLPDYYPVLEGVVQLDEAYFKSLSLVMAKQKGSRTLAYALLPQKSVGKTEAVRFLFQYIKPGSKLNTDGSSIYRNIDHWWPVEHRKDIHAKWEFTLTSEIEGMFGVLRTFIRRMYHHTTRDHMPEIVAEFVMKFSHPEIFQSPINYLEKSIRSVPTD